MHPARRSGREVVRPRMRRCQANVSPSTPPAAGQPLPRANTLPIPGTKGAPPAPPSTAAGAPAAAVNPNAKSAGPTSSARRDASAWFRGRRRRCRNCSKSGADGECAASGRVRPLALRPIVPDSAAQAALVAGRASAASGQLPPICLHGQARRLPRSRRPAPPTVSAPPARQPSQLARPTPPPAPPPRISAPPPRISAPAATAVAAGGEAGTAAAADVGSTATGAARCGTTGLGAAAPPPQMARPMAPPQMARPAAPPPRPAAPPAAAKRCPPNVPGAEKTARSGPFSGAVPVTIVRVFGDWAFA